MNILKNISNLIFGILSLLVVIFVSLGISLDFTKLAEPAFWLEILIKWALTMIMFNLAFEHDKNTRSHDKKGRFYRAFATLKLRIEEIKKEKRYGDLDNAIKLKNDELIKELWTIRINRISSRITYDDILKSELSAENLTETLKIDSKRKKKKFIRLVKKIRQGAPFRFYHLLPFKPIKDDYFLKDTELSKMSIDKFNYSVPAETVKRNLVKSFIFLFSSVVTTVLSYAYGGANFWWQLLANSFTMIMAITSGFFQSSSDMKKKTQIYENRNDFLDRYLNINVKWSDNQ